MSPGLSAVLLVVGFWGSPLPTGGPLPFNICGVMPVDSEVPYFTYAQLDGELNLEEAHSQTFIGTGYSGKGAWRNKPLGANMVAFGCIPKGWYTLEGPFDNYINSDGHHLGNCVFKLHPDKDNQMWGRSGFLIHGNNKNNDASNGCIVQGPGIRAHVDQIFKQGVKRLKVT